MPLFRRKYELAIGNRKSPDFLLVEELELSFNISFSSNNKKKIDSATFDIVNLSKEAINKLENEFAVVSFKVGYEDQGDELVQLFIGEVVNITTRKSGTEKTTVINCTPAALAVSFTGMNKIVPSGGTVVSAIEEIRKSAGLAKGEYKGVRVNTKLPYGYPLSGTPRQMLDELSDSYLLEYRIQNNALYVNDEELGIKSGTLVPLVSSETGLLEVPYYETEDVGKSKEDKTKIKSLVFESLLNTEIKCGSYVKVVHDEIDDLLKVTEATFSGSWRQGDWKVVCKCAMSKEAE